MLMFITHPCERYSIAEEVQMVLEGGCRWIQLRIKGISDDEFRQMAMEIIPLCKEHEAFLVFDDRVELSIETGVHGVHLGKKDMNPAIARETMGPEAIIGATANTADDILKLQGIDIDYIGLGPFRYTTTKSQLSPVLGIDGYRDIVSRVRKSGITLPIVAIGGITIDDIQDIMSTGVNGVAVSGSIINASDPVAYTRDILSELNKYTK